MLPERVKAAAEKAEEMTKNNDRYVRTYVRSIRIHSVARAIFNLCMPYTSRDEIATAVQSAIQERLEDEDADDT